MTGWKECRLGDIADVRDGTHDSPKQQNEGEYLITSRHIKNGKIDFSSAYKISVDDYNDVNRRSKVHKWDVLFSMIGTVGEMTIVDFEPNFAIKNIGLFKTNENKDLANWIYYYFKSNEAKEEINAVLKGSTQQYITLGDLRNFPIILPPLPEQKAIAGVLSCLDDKIDLLHRQNKTLEAMAEALFRQWFVEEVGDVWEEVELGEVVETTSGGTPSRENIDFYLNGTIYWVKSKELNGSFLFDTEEKITETALKFSSAKILPENSILIAMYGATVGEYAIISKPMTCNQAICVLKPNENYPYTYLFFLIKNNKEELINMAVGSAQQNISQLLIKKIPVLNCIEKIKQFHSTASPYFEKIKTNQTQIRTLEKLRDTLLPKLMNGEIRVEIR